MVFYVYIIACADETLYTGIATDLDRRLAEHNGLTPKGRPSRKGARYTASRRPVIIKSAREFPCRSSAMKEEARIKGLTRSAKLAIIADDPWTGPNSSPTSQDHEPTRDIDDPRQASIRRKHA